MSGRGHSRHSCYLGVSGSPQERTFGQCGASLSLVQRQGRIALGGSCASDLPQATKLRDLKLGTLAGERGRAKLVQHGARLSRRFRP